jgi:hypothetical protein
LRLALSKGPNRVDASLPSPEDRNSSSFRNVVIYIYIEFQPIDKVYILSDSECYAASSEPFRFNHKLLFPIAKKKQQVHTTLRVLLLLRSHI